MANPFQCSVCVCGARPSSEVKTPQKLRQGVMSRLHGRLVGLRYRVQVEACACCGGFLHLSRYRAAQMFTLELWG